MEVSRGTPYHIIGEGGYGKPVLDRTLKYSDPLLMLGDTAVDVAVAGDADVVRQALGEEFFSRRDTVSIDDDVAKALSALCDRLLARADALGLDAADQAVLRSGRTMAEVLNETYGRTILPVG